MNNNIKNKTTLSLTFCILALLIVFLFFYRTIFYDLKAYDEMTPFKETYLPVCFSFQEMFELISQLGLNQCFEATNTLYSNIVSLRCNPVGNFIQLFIQVICKKNPVLYHSYSLIFHMINTALVFLIINKVSLIFCRTRKPFIVFLLTLLWALHPINIEPVLLLTNGNVIFSYSLCLLTVFICINNYGKNQSFLISFLLFFLFTLALFIVEFHFILPILLISYTTALGLYTKKPFFLSFKESIKNTMPLLISIFFFLIFFLLSNTRINIHTEFTFRQTLERIFWLCPQIFFHFTKLLIFPVKLSIDQTFLVPIGKTLFDPYAIFCTSFIAIGLFISAYSFFIFTTFFLFFLSLTPFLQIFAPVYNLASERYLYFPSFVFILGLSHLLFFIYFKFEEIKKSTLVVPVVLMILLLSYSLRAYIRTQDWKDSFSLYYSAINATDNPLYKAYRYKGLTSQEKIFAKYPEKETNLEYKKLAISYLKKAILNLKDQKNKYQLTIPDVMKVYGLDPASLLSKAGYLLAQSDFTLNNDTKRSLKIIQPYVKDLNFLDSAGLAFYSSLLFHNEMTDKCEEILKFAYKRYPYALRIIFPYCDLIQIKYGNLNEIEKLTVRAFNYFPYDTFTLLILTKVYKLKGDLKKYAHFSYIYGLRHHSIIDLNEAANTFLLLNEKDKAQKAKSRILELEKRLKK